MEFLSPAHEAEINHEARSPSPHEENGLAGSTHERIAVVIPCYRVKAHILDVLARIGADVSAIFVVDDKCPEESGQHVLKQCTDPRVRVIFNDVNLGVGGATMVGIRQALAAGADICVKIDGDGQLDPALLPCFVEPIISGIADYTKGNRFYSLDHIGRMPPIRIFGNAVLSFFSKLSSGYWDIFDPTNGYVAIHANVARYLPLDKISKRFFFESDLLFHLSLLRARVIDVPMHAYYGDENSNLKVFPVILEFMKGNIKNFFRRVFYNYFLRDFSLASLYLLGAIVSGGFGAIYGSLNWYVNSSNGVLSSNGTVMLAGLPTIISFQLLLSFFAIDVSNTPSTAIHRRMKAIAGEQTITPSHDD